MDEIVAGLKQRVDAIRKTGKVPHWRMVYAEYLLNRAQEYIAVDLTGRPWWRRCLSR